MTPAAPVGPDWGFGLYIHWPFCARICPYCDFNVYAAKDRDPAPLIAALRRDLAAHARRLAGHPALTSLYFGGGTPSLMPPASIAVLVEDTAHLFGLAASAEITLEANPDDITAARLADWQAAGITRLSIGVQALDDAALAALGRNHDAATARSSLTAALGRFDTLSIDLIYARPGQDRDAWTRELTAALALGAPHLSLYELTIEPATAFGKRAARGGLIPMPDEQQADLYTLTQDICAAHGLPAYEVSNHAAGAAHRSAHNLTYWRGGDWIGLGPGAHGRLTLDGVRHATVAPRRPVDYIAATKAGAPAHGAGEALAPGEVADELLALGLRTTEGLDPGRLAALTGARPDRGRLAALAQAGWLTPDPARLVLTDAGRLLADRVAAEIAAVMAPVHPD